MMQTYEQNVARVEAIIGDLGNDAKPLSNAIALFEEAVGRLRDASDQLTAVEAKVKVLIDAA